MVASEPPYESNTLSKIFSWPADVNRRVILEPLGIEPHTRSGSPDCAGGIMLDDRMEVMIWEFCTKLTNAIFNAPNISILNAATIASISNAIHFQVACVTR